MFAEKIQKYRDFFSLLTEIEKYDCFYNNLMKTAGSNLVFTPPFEV